MEKLGQIRLGTPFGDYLYNLCYRNPSINNVVEVGTWKGLGSTECIIRGLSDSGKEGISFISIEAEPGMHAKACEVWENKLPSWARLLHGRIVDVDEMDDENLGSGHPDESLWFKQDRDAFMTCPNILDQIPSKIDFLFLDGGEFSTRSEYIKLKDRSMFIGMDDTISRKCKKIRDEILSLSDDYEVIIDNPWYGNGVMICKNKKCL